MLRALAGCAPAPLRDLAAAAGLNQVTTFRILGTLVQEGFARRPGGTQPYDLGPEVAVLATALAGRVNLRAAAGVALARLAAQSGDTAVLSIRSGNEAVCIDRQTGGFPIQSNYLHPGTRRPLGVGAGAQALLAALPVGAADRLLDTLADRLHAFPPPGPCGPGRAGAGRAAAPWWWTGSSRAWTASRQPSAYRRASRSARSAS